MSTSLPTPVYEVDPRTDVYPPSEDTFLLLDALEAEAHFIAEHVRPSIVVEIGSGSGVVSAFVAGLPALQAAPPAVFCTDLNANALRCTRRTAELNGRSERIETIRCDLLAALRLSQAVDLLLFNPPYVPTDHAASSSIELCYAGGPSGRNAVDRLFPQLPTVLSRPNGVFFLVALHSNDVPQLCGALETEGIRGVVCVKRRCGIELLYVLKYTWIS
ncbi:Methylase [Aphelenchoides fujianensis]|nr:Methylase [Aphelenchoides fujianensis]